MKLIRYLAFYFSWGMAAKSPQFDYPVLVSFGCFLPLVALTFWGQPNKTWNVFRILVLGGAGLVMDSVMTAFGFYVFPTGHDLFWPLVPLWYFPLWWGFVISMIDLADYFKDRLFWVGVLGSLGGPLSFLAGEKLGAIQIAGPYWILVILWFFVAIALTWAIQKSSPRSN